MDIARAAPSVGSVPAHNSSKRTRLLESAFLRIYTIFFIWDEKVERLCSMLCSSPISAKISLKTVSFELSDAGI